MRANRGSRTGLERRVEAELKRRGLVGLRPQWRTPLARADLADPNRRVAIFIHGCFWHGCPLCQATPPRSNTAFWAAKFARNRERDRAVRLGLRRLGWKVVEIRECQARLRPWRQAARVRAAREAAS